MIPVVFIWSKGADQSTAKKHAILPALPSTGDLVIPPGEKAARHVRTKEWDVSAGNGTAVTVYIALD